MSLASLIALSAILCTSLACRPAEPKAPSIAEQRVQHAKGEGDAAKALDAWDAHVTKAKELSDRGDHRGALTEIEHALRLVKRFGIRDEGATYNEAYTLLEAIAAPEKGGALLQLLADENLIEAKAAIISQAVAYLGLDSKAREELMALSQDRQVEALRRQLTR